MTLHLWTVGSCLKTGWQVLRLGHTFWYNKKLMEVFESYANFFYWTYEKYILQICCCPGTSKLIVGRCQTTRLTNMWPFWSALVGNHWNLRFSTEISHPKKTPWGSWSQKSSLLLGLIVAESVGFFLSQMYEHKKNHLFCYWMNFWLVKNHQGFLKSCKLAPFEKKDKRPNSCAFGSGKLSCWREKQLATGKTPGILPFGTASVPDGRAHHAQRL